MLFTSYSQAVLKFIRLQKQYIFIRDFNFPTTRPQSCDGAAWAALEGLYHMRERTIIPTVELALALTWARSLRILTTTLPIGDTVVTARQNTPALCNPLTISGNTS